jgi:hypothetical protein
VNPKKKQKQKKKKNKDLVGLVKQKEGRKKKVETI